MSAAAIEKLLPVDLPKVRVAPSSSPAPTSPADVLEAMREHPVIHASTGISALDDQTKGGPRFGDLVALLGAPDAGKTTIATALADHYAECGMAVGFCCYDDDDEDLATRLAQRRNWTRGDIEARLEFDDLVERMPSLFIYDGDWAIENVIEDLASRSGARRVVLIVDSLQTMNIATAAKASGKAEAISIGLRVLRRAAKRRRWLVIFTSEMVRDSYSGKGDRTSSLAAAKWSGDVEYFCKLVLAVRNEADSPDVLHVEVPKNKLAPKGEFFLKLDRAHQRIAAAPAPDKTAEAQAKTAAKAASTEKHRSGAATKLTKIVLKHPSIGTRELRTKAGVAGLGGKDAVDLLIEFAVQAGLIEDRPEQHKTRVDHHYFAVGQREEAS